LLLATLTHQFPPRVVPSFTQIKASPSPFIGQARHVAPLPLDMEHTPRKGAGWTTRYNALPQVYTLSISPAEPNVDCSRRDLAEGEKLERRISLQPREILREGERFDDDGDDDGDELCCVGVGRVWGGCRNGCGFVWRDRGEKWRLTSSYTYGLLA
jgi:hypothetical protein